MEVPSVKIGKAAGAFGVVVVVIVHLGNPYCALLPAEFLGNGGLQGKPGSNPGTISWHVHP